MCGSYVQNINDCLTQEASLKYYGCCGLKYNISSTDTQQICFSAPNTKAGREFFLKQIINERRIDEKSVIEYICPKDEVEVKGNCSDFATLMLNKQSDCFGLSLDDYREKSPNYVDLLACCSIKNNKYTDDYTSPIPYNVNLCAPLPKDKANRDAFMKAMIDSWQQGRETPLPFTFEDLTIVCGYSKSFSLIWRFFYLIIVLLLL